MNEKDKVWFQLSGRITADMEAEMLSKYGSKNNAIATWWGKWSAPEEDNFWELCVCKHWQREEHEEYKARKKA